MYPLQQKGMVGVGWAAPAQAVSTPNGLSISFKPGGKILAAPI
jgi:hypothetical protein